MTRSHALTGRAVVQLVDLHQVRGAEAAALAHGALHDRLEGLDGRVGVLEWKWKVKQTLEIPVP